MLYNISFVDNNGKIRELLKWTIQAVYKLRSIYNSDFVCEEHVRHNSLL